MIVRSRVENCVALSKEVLHKESLSLEAKGLWAYLIAEGVVDTCELNKIFGEKKSCKLLKELQDHQLCYRVKEDATSKEELLIFDGLSSSPLFYFAG